MVTNRQLRKLMTLLNQEATLSTAAAKAGMDEWTARKYRRLGKLPSEVRRLHDWRTRPDPAGNTDRATRQAPLTSRSRVPRVPPVRICTRGIGADEEEYAVQEGVPVLGHQGHLAARGESPAASCGADARIALEIAADDGANVWVYDISANRLSQLTFEGGTRPLWSPDGRQITFLKDGTLWNVPSDFSGPPEPLLATDVQGIIGPESWSPDGRVLLFPANGGLHALSLDNQESPAVIVPIPDGIIDQMASFSPDGRWFAYATTETGAFEIYVYPYPVVAGGKRRITTDGGLRLVWSRNGRELFYEDDGQLWVVEMTREPTLTWGNPVPVFEPGPSHRWVLVAVSITTSRPTVSDLSLQCPLRN